MTPRDARVTARDARVSARARRFLGRRKRVLVVLAGWSLLESAQTFLGGYGVAMALDRGFLAGRTGTGLLWLAVAAVAVIVGGLATGGVFRGLADLVEPLRDGLVRRVAARRRQPDRVRQSQRLGVLVHEPQRLGLGGAAQAARPGRVREDDQRAFPAHRPARQASRPRAVRVHRTDVRTLRSRADRRACPAVGRDLDVLLAFQ